MQLSPNFHDDTTGRHPVRVSFQLAVAGTEQTGIVYVTMDVSGDPMDFAPKAAKKAAKRAGCTPASVVLHRIMAPRA